MKRKLQPRKAQNKTKAQNILNRRIKVTKGQKGLSDRGTFSEDEVVVAGSLRWGQVDSLRK